MTKRLLLLIFILPAYAAGQAPLFTRSEADSMLAALKKAKADAQKIRLQLNLAQFHIFKPGQAKTDLDSADFYLSQVKNLENQTKTPSLKGYLELIRSCLIKERGNKEEGKKTAEYAVSILEKSDDKFALGRGYYELSHYYEQWKDSLDLAKKVELVKLSLDAFTEAGELTHKARSLEMLGKLYYNTNGDEKAIPILQHALALYDSINDKRVQGVYLQLGKDYYSRQDYARSLYYLLKSLRTAHQVNDTSIQTWEINTMLGKLYQDIDRQEIGIDYLKEALQVAKRYNEEYSIYNTVMNISSTYSDLGRYQEALDVLGDLPTRYTKSNVPLEKGLINLCFLNAYMKLGEYDHVPRHLNILLPIIDSSRIDDFRRANSYRTIATYYFLIKNYSTARHYLNKSHSLSIKLNYETGLLRDLKTGYQLDSAQGHYQEAYKKLLQYKVKMDSVTGVKKARQFEVLNVEYELGVKEDSIRLKDRDISLLKERNALQQLKLRQSRILRNVSIAGIFFAALIISLLYRQYRQKQKNSNIVARKNAQLQHLLSEKEWLLKEIHHRVKNNLQIVMSLLNSQSRYIDNGPALTAIHDSQHRVHSMSLIHQKLYSSDNVSTIDLSLYIKELTFYLKDSFAAGQRIRFEYDLEPLELDVSQSIPLGLILNEAITNSLKYAFPDERAGIIRISFARVSGNKWMLRISDNGIGISHDLKEMKNASLGMSLMRGLSEDLEGQFSIENYDGTTIKVIFTHQASLKPLETIVYTLETNQQLL